MKNFTLILTFMFFLVFPVTSHSIGLEFTAGGWNCNPSGYMSYEKISSDDNLDLEKDLNYDDETDLTGRVKIDMPLLFPNIYLMATPMEYDETGQKNVTFNFGDEEFDANVDFDSKLTLNTYDVGLYYGIPLLSTATLNKINIDLGINLRIIDLDAEIEQGSTKESESLILPVPMGYVGVQFKPVKKLAIEAEARGIAYSGNHYYSIIGRVKYKIFGPLFGAGGYRYEKLKIDEEDVKAEVKFQGPFIEVEMNF